MFTIYRLILAFLTRVNLSSTALYVGLLYDDAMQFALGPVIADPAHFGDHHFNPYKMPAHISPEQAISTVAEPTPHPRTFKPQGGGKTLIVLGDQVLTKSDHDFSRAYQLLAALAANEKYEVWLNTEKGLDTLESYKDIPRLNIAAEHGTVLLISQYSDEKMEIKSVHELAEKLKKAMNTVLRRHQKDFEPVVEDIRKTLTEELAGFVLRLEDKSGEVRHGATDKGNLVAHLLATGWHNRGIAIGGRESDEGMFKAMNHANGPEGDSFHAVIVGQLDARKTFAKYKLQSVDEVHQLLTRLALSKP
ncbi:hypothetical protein PtA15_13A114 [Puccinia triticina]|uniref:Uncharacterized protein n=1 Tax=Puccinia triticina TaxID=208348 RepID=A0ABY7D0F7_9BASI|nr:uncharacterized protein PtA15_13A114 [Puccinia triticina]WAQ90715.1 hypothetical protein PtA15_13A114 [Puccinia triticina]